MYTTLDLDRYSTWLEIKGNVALLRHRQAGLLRSKFDDDCIWMIRNAPYLSCPNWEDRRKSLTHIFTFVAYASPIQPNPKASALALLALLRVCLQTLGGLRASGGPNRRFLIATYVTVFYLYLNSS